MKDIHTARFASPPRGRHVRVLVSGKAIHADPKFTSVILQELLVHSAPAGAPRAPTDLVVTAPSPGRVALQWRDVSANETGFEIHRRELGTSQWHLLHTAAADATHFVADAAAPGRPFAYRVRAINDRGASLYSSDSH